MTDTTDVAPPPPTTETTQATTTTLPRLPEALTLTSDDWEWQPIAATSGLGEVRFDGTHLAFAVGRGEPVRVLDDQGALVIEHRPLDDREWIVQDVELGDRWLAVVENTEGRGLDHSRLVVYDLSAGAVAMDEVIEQTGDLLWIPWISLSGSYMAVAGQMDNPGCVTIHDLRAGIAIDDICAAGNVFSVEIEANSLAFEAKEPECRTAWTGTLYGPDHNLVSHSNRACWSGSPATGGGLTVWFESPPDQIGIDTMIGVDRNGRTVGLGRGDNGTLEICWGRAYWVTGDKDVRMWDGGDAVHTIYEAGDDQAFHLGCVGPWVTFRTMDAVYSANMFTESPAGACEVCYQASVDREDRMADELLAWVHDRFEDLPADLEASVSGAIGADEWWVAHGGFSSHLEGAIFLWDPDGNISLAWSGSAASEYEIREYMLTTLPEAPPAMLGCVDLDGYYDL